MRRDLGGFSTALSLLLPVGIRNFSQSKPRFPLENKGLRRSNRIPSRKWNSGRACGKLVWAATMLRHSPLPFSAACLTPLIHSNSVFRCPSNSVKSVKLRCPPVPPLSLLTFLFPPDAVFVCFICGDGVFNSFAVFAAENVVLAVAFYFV